MASYKEDIRFKQGRKLLNENKFEEAIEFFSSLLQSQISAHGEESIEVAPIWYEYGRGLLMKEQENPSDDLLGAVAEEAKKQAKSLGEELNAKTENTEDDEEEENDEEEDKEENGDQEEDGNGEEGADAGEEVSDMEVAWEALEVARKIYEKEQDPTHDISLSEVYESLGDVHKFNGNFPAAIDEYTRSVGLREVACEDHDRLLAQAYYSLAVAYIYLSGEKEEGENAQDNAKESILSAKRAALRHYQKAKEVLLKPPPSSHIPSTEGETSTPDEVERREKEKKDREDRSELCDEISETIIALEQEIRRLSGTSSSSLPLPPSSMIGASSTTIGFGQTSSTSAPLLEVTIFDSTPSSSISQVKRKATNVISSSTSETKRNRVEPIADPIPAPSSLSLPPPPPDNN